MSNFTAAATRLSGLVSLLFHWTPEQFWQATPQELRTLFAALDEVRDAKDASAYPPDADTLAALRRAFPDYDRP